MRIKFISGRRDQYARLVFERCNRDKRQASRVLDISCHTLNAYLRYGTYGGPAGKRVPAWAKSPPATASSD